MRIVGVLVGIHHIPSSQPIFASLQPTPDLAGKGTVNTLTTMLASQPAYLLPSDQHCPADTRSLESATIESKIPNPPSATP